MAERHIHRKIDWTPEDLARHRAIREEFKDRPTIEQLRERGYFRSGMTMGTLMDLLQALHELKAVREQAGLSLADVAERSGIDKAALSRLENGIQANPTVETLLRYAAAVGKRLRWTLEDAPAA
jgi:DNA-binding XRE family transcriptional regulator